MFARICANTGRLKEQRIKPKSVVNGRLTPCIQTWGMNARHKLRVYVPTYIISPRATLTIMWVNGDTTFQNVPLKLGDFKRVELLFGQVRNT